MALLSTQTLELDQIQEWFHLAKIFKKGAEPPPPLLAGKSISLLFFENSTRTRVSFEQAIRRLGGQSTFISSAIASVQKGESLLDTIHNLKALAFNAFVVRHPNSGALHRLHEIVINAGDGTNEHPTQALLDAFTLQECLGSLQGKSVLIVGDIANSRVAKSNIYLLQKCGAKIKLSGPPTLVSKKWEALGCEINYHLDHALEGVDAAMFLRIQHERASFNRSLSSTQEFHREWGLTSDRILKLPKSIKIMAPGPVNWDVEISSHFKEERENNLILEQTKNGVFVRMAVLSTILNSGGTKEWLKKTQIRF